MSDKTTVLFNGECPICSREIRAYEKRAAGQLNFVDLNQTDLAQWGLNRDDAARRLYVVRQGELLAGVDAFRVLWAETPGFGWLARFVGLPVVRQVAEIIYEYMLAPLLFRMHKRREARNA